MLTLNVPCPDPSPSVPTVPTVGTWVPNSIASFTGLDFQGAAPGDTFAFYGSSSGSGPVSSGRQITVAILFEADVLTVDQPANWSSYNFIGAVRVRGTSTGVFATFQGTGSGGFASSPTSFTWQVTLAAATASNLNPPAWQANYNYSAGDVVAYANGAYGSCTVGGHSGGTEPAPEFYGTLEDNEATFLLTGPQGFEDGVQWIDVTAGDTYTSGSPNVSPSNGFGPIVNGTETTTPNQPSEVYVYSASGGEVTVQGYV